MALNHENCCLVGPFLSASFSMPVEAKSIDFSPKVKPCGDKNESFLFCFVFSGLCVWKCFFARNDDRFFKKRTILFADLMNIWPLCDHFGVCDHFCDQNSLLRRLNHCKYNRFHLKHIAQRVKTPCIYRKSHRIFGFHRCFKLSTTNAYR